MRTDLAARFAALFDGLDQAFGTGRGEWVKRPPRPEDFQDHLDGKGPGIGIAPLRPDNTVKFAAIDLDEPDFVAAREMQGYLPGTSFVERSRSGNAHVWVFFREPLEAWIAMGVMREVTLAAGKEHVEVFPKNHDFAKVRLGNYINLPYHGSDRPILDTNDYALSLEEFLTLAEDYSGQNEAEEWRKKARWLLISPPEQRERRAEFGAQRNLHSCADRLLSGEAGVITEGNRNAILFMLAKALTNWEQVDHDETWEILSTFNREMLSPSEDESELRRVLANAERGQYTSTGCDDPLVLPFADPNCPIAHPRRR